MITTRKGYCAGADCGAPPVAKLRRDECGLRRTRRAECGDPAAGGPSAPTGDRAPAGAQPPGRPSPAAATTNHWAGRATRVPSG
ncbi:hypothetical protein GCM10018781_77040 [Kitasatospora indigofera]|uniref:Uncharacterized protein n=1 Tax=Kitasatospora indigofera TaxID=67307 RepID=A0A918YUY7_9ACTN|nr:hypothetical protein GCM10018781_77040 [Kitasatospora indigofera]